MNLSRNRFLYWVMYFPIVINVLVYVGEVISGTISWFYAEPNSEYSSAQRILDRGNTLDDFLRIRLLGLTAAIIIGLVIWLWEYYSIKKIENTK